MFVCGPSAIPHGPSAEHSGVMRCERQQGTRTQKPRVFNPHKVCGHINAVVTAWSIHVLGLDLSQIGFCGTAVGIPAHGILFFKVKPWINAHRVGEGSSYVGLSTRDAHLLIQSLPSPTCGQCASLPYKLHLQQILWLRTCPQAMTHPRAHCSQLGPAASAASPRLPHRDKRVRGG